MHRCPPFFFWRPARRSPIIVADNRSPCGCPSVPRPGGPGGTVMTCRPRLVVVLLATVILADSARGQTWTGAAADSGNWNNAANWSPAIVPNTTAADAVFGATGVGNVSILSGVATRSLTFTNPTGSYNLNSSSATINSLSSITVGSAVTAAQTINLANVPSGSLLFPNGNG